MPPSLASLDTSPVCHISKAIITLTGEYEISLLFKVQCHLNGYDCEKHKLISHSQIFKYFIKTVRTKTVYVLPALSAPAY